MNLTDKNTRIVAIFQGTERIFRCFLQLVKTGIKINKIGTDNGCLNIFLQMKQNLVHRIRQKSGEINT